HGLGHRGCVESLRADLRDLQAAIADVSSRAGAARFPSWKFPDKVSCELDVAALLERYRYAEDDPELTQHSHVALLELLIDRLLLLLQSFTGYADSLLSEQALPPAQAVGPCMSAGLTARRYWSSMLKLGTLYQQLLAEKVACRKEIPTLQSAPQAGKPKEQHLKCCSPTASELRTSTEVAQAAALHPLLGILAADGDALHSSLPRAARGTTKSSCSVPTQTTSSSLAPCETCTSAQVCLREVGKAITSVCQSQNIPSALSKFQMLEESAGRRSLSATDMSYWASEQSKDLSRISKHFHMLLQQVDPLKSKLEESEKQKDKLQKQVEDFSQLLQAEKETQARQRKEAEQSLEAQNREHLEAIAKLEQDKENLQRAGSFSPHLPSLGQRCVSPPEVSKTTLLEEMKTKMVTRSVVLELEEKVQLLTRQQESLGEELSTTTTELEKEKVKVASVLRHQESLQAKQDVLLQQLESLDQEREELQARLGEAEEDKARLAEQLEESRQQSGQQLRAQQANVSRLEEGAQEMKERERLLVFFPELHISDEMQFESTGSLTEDMEKQLQANSIRIDVLQQDNARLKSALAKVKAAAEQGVLKLVPPTQLWPQLSSQHSREDTAATHITPTQDTPASPCSLFNDTDAATALQPAASGQRVSTASPRPPQHPGLGRTSSRFTSPWVREFGPCPHISRKEGEEQHLHTRFSSSTA
ncbi:CC157 protein, partial [Heliornis fulica]|nr:CC157 protein [Heliornis fulica]